MKKRLELTIVIAIFFPVVVAALLGAAGKTSDEINKAIISWSVLVGLYLASYCFFETTKHLFSEKMLTILNWTAWTEIVLFIIPIIFPDTLYGSRPPY